MTDPQARSGGEPEGQSSPSPPSASPGPSPSEVRLVVLFGGQSAEHDVSCATAVHVLAAAREGNYSIVPVGITRDGTVVHADAAAELLADATAELPDRFNATGQSVSLTPLLQGLESTGLTPHEAAPITVALPLLHGPLGEDGTVQGLLELTDVPYVGSGVLGSALAMDKAKAKEVLAAAGVPQTRWLTLFEPTWDGDLGPVIDEIGLPCFVKPANMGSSVGVSRAGTEDELRNALALAFRYDEWVVVEEAVTAREIEFGVLGNVELSVSVAGEVVPGADFYDYEDKYVDGSAELLIPASLPPGAAEEMTELAKAAFRALRCEGMARADFLFEEGGRGPLLNELNTIPGFTPMSMFPKLWEASGLSYPELIDELVRLAIERHQRRTRKRITDH